MGEFDVVTFPGPAELARTVAGRWLDSLVSTRGARQCVALSGGRIARDFFAAIAQQARARGEAMGHVHFFWADERCVPPTDPESNFALAREMMFEPLKIPDTQIHRLRGEINEDAALRRAVDEVTSLATAQSAGGLPVLDLVFLGMGEDGHVASLFPGEPAAVMADPAIYRAVTAVKPPPRRFTLGYGMLACAREVWVLASGKGKEAALRESLQAGGRTPLGRVLAARRKTLIFTDMTG